MSNDSLTRSLRSLASPKGEAGAFTSPLGEVKIAKAILGEGSMSNSRTERARALRRNQTFFERKVWVRIRNRQLGGLKFKRQAPVGPYFADFLCEEAALIIELDGDQHGKDEGAARDVARDAFLGNAGLEVFRDWNNDFMRDPNAMLDYVLQIANERIERKKNSLTRSR